MKRGRHFGGKLWRETLAGGLRARTRGVFWFRVSGLGLRVLSSGLRAQGWGLGLGVGVWGLGGWELGLGLGLGCRLEGHQNGGLSGEHRLHGARLAEEILGPGRTLKHEDTCVEVC
jgi:hypothetical protein